LLPQIEKTPQKNASIFIGQRKYLRWAMKILALALESTFIFWGSFLKKNAKEMQNYFLSISASYALMKKYKHQVIIS